MIKKPSTPLCFTCSAPLIFISEELIKPEGSRFVQTNTVYRCSNDECQKLKDKEREKRLLMKQKKEESDQLRIETVQKKKALLLAEKAENNK